MQEEIRNKLEEAVHQVKEAKKYADLYQKGFQKQADSCIESIHQKTADEINAKGKEAEETIRKIQEMGNKMEEGNLREVLEYFENRKGE